MSDEKRQYLAADGTIFDDDDIIAMAADAENGFPNSTLTGEPAPWNATQPMTTRSVRVPETLWHLIETAAKNQGVTTSEYTRNALAESLLHR